LSESWARSTGPAPIAEPTAEAEASDTRTDLPAADREAALGALESHLTLRAGTYPYGESAFDFWPVAARGGLEWIIGVGFVRARRERPASPERYVDIVRGYVAAAVGAVSSREEANG